MKIAIFISEIMWTTHLGTGLEIIQKHLDAGDEAVSFVCNSFLGNCDQNLEGSKEICDLCINKRKKGFSLLSKNIRNIEINFVDKNYNYLKQEMALPALMKIKHKGFDAGIAAASSLISRKRDAYLSVSENFELFNKLINKSSGLYDFFIDKLQQEKPETVYVFNGRLVYDRALLRACEYLKIKYVIFDGAADFDKYTLIENAMIHDIVDFQKRANNLWEKSKRSEMDKEKMGEKFYLERRYGASKSRHFFVEGQQDNLLPEQWDDSLNNIVCFLSSEDEFAAIGDQWVMDVYKNQLDGLTKISDSLKEMPGSTRLYVRVHPNTLNTNPGFLKAVDALQSQNVFIIPPASPVSTYTLMIKCNKVITFGSTTGIEATFWGKPSINLGKCFYMDMGVAYNPKNHQEVLELIQRKGLTALPKNNTIKYGYYFMDDGIEFKYYKPADDRTGSFKKTDLHKYNLPLNKRIRENIKAIIPGTVINIYRSIRYN